MNRYDSIPKRRKGGILATLSILIGGLMTLLLSVTITGQADRVTNVPPLPQALTICAIGLRNSQHEWNDQRYSERLSHLFLNERDWARIASDLSMQPTNAALVLRIPRTNAALAASFAQVLGNEAASLRLRWAEGKYLWKLLSSLLSYGSSLLRTPITFPGVEVAGFTIPSLVLPLGLLVTGLLIILGVVVLVSPKTRRARTNHPGEQIQELAHFAGDKVEAHRGADERAGEPTAPKHASPRSQAGRPQGYAPTAVKRAPRDAGRPQGDAERTPRDAGRPQGIAGRPQGIAPTGQGEADLSCPNCGQLLPADATFCSHCGVLLAASESGQISSLSIPPSSPLETSESSQGGTSPVGANRGARPAHPNGRPARQSFHDSLPLPASLVRDEPRAQIGPEWSSNEHVDMAIPSSSDGEGSIEGCPYTGLTVGARSHPGIKRQHRPNEDSLLVAQGMRTHTAPSQPFGVFLVADGMGGQKYGQEASSLAIQTMIDQMLPKLSDNLELRNIELRQLLIDAVRAANQAIHQRNQEQHASMGTTITAALVVGLTAFVANVGDSRTYLYREPEGLRKITKDHSVVAYLVETGIIKPDDIYTHAQRNQIYRSLGANPLIQVDTFIEPLQPGDLVLLCSDGLWEMVRDERIQQILRNGTDPSQMASALIEAALDGGGADNVSVIVVHAAHGSE